MGRKVAMIHPYVRGITSTGTEGTLFEGVRSIAVSGKADGPQIGFYRADGRTVRLYLRRHESGIWVMDVDDPDLTPENIGFVDWVALGSPGPE